MNAENPVDVAASIMRRDGQAKISAGPLKAPSSRYAPLYPSVWLKEEPGRGWWVTAAFSMDEEISDLSPTQELAQVVAETWREDFAKGLDLTCPECAGDGSRPCSHCEGSGRAVIDMAYDGDQIIGDCPRTQECQRCRGQGSISRVEA